MNCGSPIGRVGVHPEPGSGVDLADRAAGLADRLGDVGADEVDAGDVEARPSRAASSAISTFSGCASKVRSMEMPPVDMLPVQGQLDHLAGRRARRRACSPGRRAAATAASSTLIRVSTFSWPTPRRGSALVSSTSCSTVLRAVADHVRRHPLGDRRELAVDDQAAVVLAGDVATRRSPSRGGTAPWRSGRPRGRRRRPAGRGRPRGRGCRRAA